MVDKKVTELTNQAALTDDDLFLVINDPAGTPASQKVAASVVRTNHYPQTTAESTAGVTPTDYSLPPGNAKRYGATGDGSTNDQAALQNWLDCGEAHLTLPSGVYILNTGIATAETSNIGKIEGLGMPTLKRGNSVTPTTTILSIYDENKIEVTGIRFDGNQTGNAPIATPSNWGDVAVIATLTAVSNLITQDDYWVTFTNCEFIDSPGSALAGAGMQNTLVQNCRFTEWLDHAFYASGDSGVSRGLGTTTVVDGCIFYCSANANYALKFSNNTSKHVVSNNTFELVGEGCVSVNQGTTSHTREFIFTGNVGLCSQVAALHGANNAPNDNQGQYIFADNNMVCSDRGFYLGDTASNQFSGHLILRGGSYRNSFAGWKVLFDARFLDNANSETSITMDGVYLKDFGIQQGNWPKIFTMKNCICDTCAAAWFYAIGSDDSTAKIVTIEDNQFLNAATNQGGCSFKLSEASQLIIRGNFYNSDGIALSLSDTFPGLVIVEDNTMLDVQGMLFDAASTARSSAGLMIFQRNKSISTVGSSVNTRLINENTTTGTILGSYNVICRDNFFRDTNQGVWMVGSAVTGFGGSTIIYWYGNHGIGSSHTISYPAANNVSYPPGAGLGATPSYTVSNDATDRVWDANQAAGTISATPTQAEVENIRDAVLELSDVVATISKDLGLA